MTENNAPAEPQSEASEAPVKIKAMRRQPCPCGSGKVFKNCHEGDPGYEVATDPTTASAAPVTASKNVGKGPAHLQTQMQSKNFNSASRNTGVARRRKV